MESVQIKRRRTIAVIAVDEDGRPVPAEIGVTVGGTPAGMMFLAGTTPHASIELAGKARSVELQARYFDQTLLARLGPGEAHHEFRFRAVRTWEGIESLEGEVRTATLGGGRAQCPDGSTGTPCVTCDVGGISVRLCV